MCTFTDPFSILLETSVLSWYSRGVSVSLRGIEAARGPGVLDSTSSKGAIEVDVFGWVLYAYVKADEYKSQSCG